MKKILSLDLSGQTGWAFQSADGSTSSGVTPFLGTLNPGSRWLRFDCWLEAWDEAKPELIAYEEPIVHFKHKHGLGLGYGFEAILRLHCTRKEICCRGVNISVLKKWSTGDGRADKWKMVRFARQIKPDVSNDNESDAILLLEYARKVIVKESRA
jgi:hypothetical protein